MARKFKQDESAGAWLDKSEEEKEL